MRAALLLRSVLGVSLLAALLAVPVAAAVAAAPAVSPATLKPFDGATLNGWQCQPEFWSVEDGVIVGRATPGHLPQQSQYLVWKGPMPRDFELRCKMRLAGEGANSGIQYRSAQVAGQADLAGFQMDFDSADAYTGVLYEGLGRQLMSARGEQVEWTPSGKRLLARFAPDTVLRKAIKHDDWNEFRIVAEGTRVRHWINGTLMSDVTDGDASRFRGDGVLAFQLHAGHPMEVRIKELEVTPITTAPPASVIAVPEGFKVELLASAQPGQGSWASIAFDPRGRAVISPQAGELLRATIPGVSRNKDGTPVTGPETVVQHTGAHAGSAQGLCFVGNDLFMNGNVEGEGIALWRLSDADGDDSWETKTALVKYVSDGGEHGPHGIVAGPDGALYVCLGNHTVLPPELVLRATDQGSGSAPNSPYTGFGEDTITPRMWDPRGHAVGIYAPGGVVLRVDPASGAAGVFAGGFRNAYDQCFNAEGQLITYDSDMEWDIGAPWYRAPRVVHVVQGGEYGWRSGSTCWPDWYADSLPPACETDSASPTGMLSGHQSAWPEPWKSTIFCGDWTYGRILAVTLTPTGSTYTAQWQPWATGRPMPVSDMAWGPDGQMYVVTGGRNTQSGLYRISWAGSGKPAAAAPPSGDQSLAGPDWLASQRAARSAVERLQRPIANPELTDAVPFLLAGLEASDRFIQSGARVALEHQPVGAWAKELGDIPSARGRVAGAIALARAGNQDQALQACGMAAQCLAEFGVGEASADDAAGAIRAVQIAIARHPDLRNMESLRALGTMLALLAADAGQSSAEGPLIWLALETACTLGEARATPLCVERMTHAPDRATALRYATMLRCAQHGWTDELRSAYWSWLNAADDRAGGFSLRGFIEQIKRDAAQAVGRPTGASAPSSGAEPGAPAAGAQGSGKVALPPPAATSATLHAWTVAELEQEQAADAARDLARGARIFREASCILCHRFNGEGATTGPDLTGVGGRFTRRDLLESILQPSATLSDQYRDSAIETTDGDVVVGRIVSRTSDAIEVRTNPLTEDRERIPAARVAKITELDTSSMPSGLLDSRTRAEIMDLLAYLQSAHGH